MARTTQWIQARSGQGDFVVEDSLKCRYGWLASVALVASLAGPQARSQSVDASGATGLQEVVVSARKRAESLLDVPVAVSALTAADIDNRGITSLADVAAFTPSLTASPTGGGSVARVQQTLVIRGMTPPGETSTSQTMS